MPTMPISAARLLAAALAAVLATAVLLSGPPVHAQEVDDYPTYQGQVSCDPAAKPGVLAARKLLLAKFGGGSGSITRACSSGGLSEHKEGRAWDWSLRASRAKDRRIARRATTWLTRSVGGQPAAHARQLGVMYVIWNRRIWRGYDAAAGWQPYSGENPHTDHIHVSFTWNGATKRTSWWTGAPRALDHGPCPTWVGELAEPWKEPNLSLCPTPLRRPVANHRGIYRAQEGETIARVSRWFDRSSTTIRRWNGWPASGRVEIRPGQKVRVRPRT